MTRQERTALARYADYQRSSATSLRDVYGSWSDAKERAWRYCQERMLDHDGYGLKIVTHNQTMFTAGFEFPDPETGVLKFMFITKSYDVAVEV